MQLNVFTAIQMDDVDFLKEFLLLGVLPEDGLISGAIDHTRCLRFLLEEFPHLINRAYGHRFSQLREPMLTPLMEACNNFIMGRRPEDRRNGESLQSIEMLLEHGANPNLKSPFGWSPIMMAIAGEETAIEKKLLSCGANITEQEMAFCKLVSSFRIGALDESLIAIADINHITEPFGETLLCEAARKNDLPGVTRLLELGADPNVSDIKGCTPLMHAAGIEDYEWTELSVEVVKALLSAGSDPHKRRPMDGRTALALALFESHTDISELLISAGADYWDAYIQLQSYESACERTHMLPVHVSTIYYLLQNEEWDLAKKHISRLPDINGSAGYGDNPLMYYCSSGKMDCVKFLLEQGANPSVVSWRGESAVKNAVWSGHPDLIPLLINFGLNLDTRDAAFAQKLAERKRFNLF